MVRLARQHPRFARTADPLLARGLHRHAAYEVREAFSAVSTVRRSAGRGIGGRFRWIVYRFDRHAADSLVVFGNGIRFVW